MRLIWWTPWLLNVWTFVMASESKKLKGSLIRLHLTVLGLTKTITNKNVINNIGWDTDVAYCCVCCKSISITPQGILLVIVMLQLIQKKLAAATRIQKLLYIKVFYTFMYKKNRILITWLVWQKRDLPDFLHNMIWLQQQQTIWVISFALLLMIPK